MEIIIFISIVVFCLGILLFAIRVERHRRPSTLIRENKVLKPEHRNKIHFKRSATICKVKNEVIGNAWCKYGCENSVFSGKDKLGLFVECKQKSNAI